MASTRIKDLKARQILDAKGKPMLEVDVITEGGIMGRGASPSGISAGSHEAFVLRDNDPAWFGGLSVFRAVEIVHHQIAPALLGMEVTEQAAIDQVLLDLDGTEYKTNLGGNTLGSVSLACIRAAANTQNLPLYRYLNPGEITTIPLPTVNYISGGSYQKGSMPFQECTVVPYRAQTILEAVHILYQMYQMVPAVIQDYQNGRPAVPGGLSGWQSSSPDPTVAFDILYETARRCGAEEKIAFAADCAASELYNAERNTYDYVGTEVDLDTVLGKLRELTTKYNFLYVEDPVDENDWEGWQKAAKVLDRTMLVGDDLTVTNIRMLRQAVEKQVCQAFILKPNQVGTITETIAAVKYARDHGIITILSVRAGGAGEDPSFDFAIAFGSCAVKHGPPKNGERVYGINFLTRVADEYPAARPYDFTPHIRF